jgi:hypothetical protein
LGLGESVLIETVQESRRRAGFWRRLLASIIDYLVVFVPLYLVVAALFSVSNGAVQGSFLLRFNACYETSVNWNSEPPAGIDVWNWCGTSVLGLTTVSTLVGTSTTNKTEIALPLDADRQVREDVFDVGAFDALILFIYLFFMEWRSGRPIGKRIMAVVVHDVDGWERHGLPIKKAFRRQLAKAAGLLPMAVVQTIYSIALWMNAIPADKEQQSIAWTVIALASIAIAVAWFIWIAISIIVGRDPIHDRYAGTSARIDTD